MDKKSRKRSQRSGKPFLFKKGSLASGDLYVSLLLPLQNFQTSNQLHCAGSVCVALVEILKDYIQGRQILLFVVYERSLKLD